MRNIFEKIFKFVTAYPGVIYSLFLLIFLPVMLYYNTYFTLKSLQSNIDYSLHTKAILAENILGNFFSELLDNPEALQEKIDNIAKDNNEIKGLAVLKEESGGEFKVIASQKKEEVGTKENNPSLVLSYSQNQSVADLSALGGERFWNVARPLYDKDTGEKNGLIMISLSLADSDALISRAVLRSYAVVFAIIVLSIFLVIQHTRLFSYVSLSAKLKEVDGLKDDFIRMTTHELRSPVVAVRGYIDMMFKDMEEKLTPKEKQCFERAMISAKNLNDLIDDILEVSRIEQGRLDFALEQISPGPKIDEILKELKIKADAKNLALNSDIVKGDYIINVNPNRFRQVIVNLIENSIKYTPSGSIDLKTVASEAKERYIIEIRDTGLGISAEAQEHLFEKFYRVKTSKTADIPGTGLGLWIVKQIVEKMNGQIFMESMEGSGTKFTINFPLVKKHV